MHITTYLDVIIMFFIDIGDFPINPLFSGFNSLWQKMLFFSVFDFTGATGLGKGKGQGERLGNFETNKMS
jgi:hypothetical protein